MNDTDQTNIYSYKGQNYTGDLMAYLTAQGLIIRTVEYGMGYITVMAETAQYNFPQYVKWTSMASRIKSEEVVSKMERTTGGEE